MNKSAKLDKSARASGYNQASGIQPVQQQQQQYTPEQLEHQKQQQQQQQQQQPQL